jgi:hypothetical protein
MDPYLEDPKIWPDVHDRLAFQISVLLNRTLPTRYFAQLGAREEVSLVDDDRLGYRVPDVAIHDRAGSTGTAVATEHDTDAGVELEIFITAKTNYVEIVDSEGRNVVTIIEVLSPVNKTGMGRDEFAARRAHILQSHSSYVEIDLLRSGDRTWPPPFPQTATETHQPRPEYAAVISRAWQRMPSFHIRMHPIYLQRRLPRLGIPLVREESPVMLDLQAVFDQVYDDGPYRRGAVHYDRPPRISLSPEQNLWAEECLKNRLR